MQACQQVIHTKRSVKAFQVENIPLRLLVSVVKGQRRPDTKRSKKEGGHSTGDEPAMAEHAVTPALLIRTP